LAIPVCTKVIAIASGFGKASSAAALAPGATGGCRIQGDLAGLGHRERGISASSGGLGEQPVDLSTPLRLLGGIPVDCAPLLVERDGERWGNFVVLRGRPVAMRS